MTSRILVVLIAGAWMQASAQTRPPEPAPQNPPLTLAQVTMSPDATKRAHLQEINLETARKLSRHLFTCASFSADQIKFPAAVNRSGLVDVSPTDPHIGRLSIEPPQPRKDEEQAWH